MKLKFNVNYRIVVEFRIGIRPWRIDLNYYVVEAHAWSFSILIMTYPIYNCKLCGRIQKIWNAGTFLKTKPQRQVATFKAEQKTGLKKSFAHHRYQLSTAASGKINIILLLVNMKYGTFHCISFLLCIEYYCYFLQVIQS